MNIGLRTRHRRWIPLCAILSFGSLALALYARKPQPVVAQLPPQLSNHPPLLTQALDPKAPIERQSTTWIEGLEVSAFRGSDGSFAVELKAFDALHAPDLLALLAPPNSAQEGLSERARLLGGLSATESRRFPLARTDLASDLWIYSLGQGRLLAHAPLAKLFRQNTETAP